ncbi:ABC transporter ATP-binding protein [Ruminococcaceae bacterium OttesenSCG-928-O06]|nr:ABC transporter ATP-binding protein [Ruminococcaceae bacterium OttesenSCG-928-O06]
MGEIILDVQDLHTHFFTDQGEAPAVDGVDFTVRAGEILGIVGESGSGKSVTSLSIMRILSEPAGRIVKGSVLFGGKDLARLPQKEMCKIRGDRISMIFQEPMTALNPVRTIGSQIMEMYKIHRKMDKKQAKEKSIEMLQKVGIPSPAQRFNEYPHQLSGGMRQRAMIAMALACDPQLLIADEPTTALDVTIQAQILDLMRDLQREFGTAIMLITHDLGIVSEMAHRVMVMYAGSVVEYGTRDEVFSKMLHPYTIGLMESIPRIREDTGPLSAIEGMVPSIYGMPKGCKFAPRCKYACALCEEKRPALYNVDGHQVRCFMYSEEWKGDVPGAAKAV